MDPAARPLTQLRADDLVAVLVTALDSMVVHAPALDRLDRLDQLDGIEGGDTGSHLVATLQGVVAAVGSAPTFSELADALTTSADVASGAGVGRSGRLLVTFLSGIGELCRNADALDAMRLAMAFEAGVDALDAAGPASRPGALPAVAAAVASAALAAADADASLDQVVVIAAEAGLDALERTPAEWPPLAEAGVVDAGSAGLLVVVDALVAVVHGDDPEPPEWDFPPDDLEDEGVDDGARYDVTLRLDAPGVAPDDLGRRLQRAWFALGEEVQLLTSGTGVTASVCTDDIGAVIESAIGLGRPSEIVVRDRRG